MLTEGEKLRAQRMLGGQGLSYNAVSKRLGISADRLRRELKTAKPRGRHAVADIPKAVVDDGEPVGMRAAGFSVDPQTLVIPHDILVERDRILSAPRSLTAILCGDPPPGRSALDKRQLRLVSSR